MSLAENIGSLISTVKKLKDPQLMEQVVNLQTSVLELQERVRELEKENEKLKRRQAISGSLVVEHGVYFTEKSQKKDGPFCTRCWDVESKLVRLIIMQNNWATCPECKNTFAYKSTESGSSIRGFRGSAGSNGPWS